MTYPVADRAARNQVKAGFTLIELMVVVGIMAVMFSLAIPAYQNLTKGSKVTGAMLQLKNTFSLARQHAITRREKTYVVFPPNDIATSSTYEYGLRSYRVYSESWKFLSDWYFLPEGLIFDPDGSVSDSNVTNLLYSTITEFSITNFPDENGVVESMYAVAFNQDGSLKTVNNALLKSPAIFLTEGWTFWDGSKLSYSNMPNSKIGKFIKLSAWSGMSKAGEYVP